MKSAALESKALRDLQESLLLKALAEKSADISDLQPQAAADLARAARDALLAAERLALTRVLEAQERLEALKDSLDQAHAQVKEAEVQMQYVMSAIEDRQVLVFPTPDFTCGLPDPLPLSIPLSECDLEGAHLDDHTNNGDFDLEFDDDYNGVDSEAEDEDEIWEPGDNAAAE